MLLPCLCITSRLSRVSVWTVAPVPASGALSHVRAHRRRLTSGTLRLEAPPPNTQVTHHPSTARPLRPCLIHFSSFLLHTPQPAPSTHREKPQVAKYVYGVTYDAICRFFVATNWFFSFSTATDLYLDICFLV